jgi:hypothetical protein
MARMTEEEANALDEYYTKNPPKIDPSKKGGFFTRQRELLEPQPSLKGEGSPLAVLDRVSADYIMTRAISTNKMPAQIIGEMVREKITASL